MTSDPHGWPDPAQPGVPLNPERDGWHWVAECAREWSAMEQAWLDHAGDPVLAFTYMRLPYEGPCLTSAEVAAREAAAAEAMRSVLLRWQNYGCPDCGGDCASANPPVACCIMQETRDALSLPAPGALDRVREEARREGMEEAANIAEHDAITEPDENGCQWVIRHGDPEIAADIRARMEEGA